MRIVKLFLLVLIVLVLQTVFFARLNLFGTVPDLVLITTIVVTILLDRPWAFGTVLVMALMQDALCAGPFLNVFSKLLAFAVTDILKENFIDSPQMLSLGLTAFLTPVLMVIEFFILQQFMPFNLSGFNFTLKIFLMTIYNTVLVYPVFVIINGTKFYRE